MRGKQRHVFQVLADYRIIPAHAGQTARIGSARSYGADHPRACGANVVVGMKPSLRFGSSPRMRGKPRAPRLDLPVHRIIPAHAGQTLVTPDGRRIVPDHPRACGANAHSRRLADDTAGSSPRMRGKPGVPRCGPRRCRIIPAHAGQTRTSRPSSHPRPDHPRACGANSPILCENS